MVLFICWVSVLHADGHLAETRDPGLPFLDGVALKSMGSRVRMSLLGLLQRYVGGLKYSHRPQIASSSKLDAPYYRGKEGVVDAHVNWVKNIYHAKEMGSERGTYPCSPNNFLPVNGISERMSTFLLEAWRSVDS